MKEQLVAKDVIDSLQSIVINLENRRLNSLNSAKLHHKNRHYSFMHFFTGQVNGYKESIDLLKICLYRLIIEN
ncbi:unnamed protein product [marine sediment metagenome]|uniref:Uncharacterized protein n=1 Tax=marine sediment metagenome TaxID=412755 RepID=X0ZP30_9ZZZZ